MQGTGFRNDGEGANDAGAGMGLLLRYNILLALNMEYGGCVYIMTNKHKTTLYIGVTSDIVSRIHQHKGHYYPLSFTAKYNLEYCVYYECFSRIEEAIEREKVVKKWRREKKDALINKMNPEWLDLWDELSSE